MHTRFLRKLTSDEQRLYNLGYRDGEKSNQKPFKYIPDKEPVDDINIFSKIKFKVSKYYKISEKELFGPQRDSYLVFPRSMAINLMRELTYLRFSQIGFLINRDHTTLVYHVSLRINKKGYWKIPNNHAVYNQLKTELINESQQ
tara:strand:- start:19 stop:450 length:432 start_codon:yes stop_codon:yes gene_type:complete